MVTRPALGSRRLELTIIFATDIGQWEVTLVEHVLHVGTYMAPKQGVAEIQGHQTWKAFPLSGTNSLFYK